MPRAPRVRVESDQSVKKRDLERVRRAKLEEARTAQGRRERGVRGSSPDGRLSRARRSAGLHGDARQVSVLQSLPPKAPQILLLAVVAIVLIAAAIGVVSCAVGAVSAPPASVAEESGAEGVSDSAVGVDSQDGEDNAPAAEDAEAERPQTAQDAQPVDFAQHMGVVYQMEELEGGCEIAALTSVLESMGFDLDSRTIADNYLSYDEGDMVHGYSGDPYYYGGSFPPPIVDAANAYLEAQSSPYRAMELTGSSFDELTAWVEKGYPVLVWSTMYLDEPQMSGIVTETYEWYDNEHCVVYYGQDGSDVLVSDPLEGLVSRDAAQFQRIYEECGSMAAVIR